jgi:hypothetical protein
VAKQSIEQAEIGMLVRELAVKSTLLAAAPSLHHKIANGYDEDDDGNHGCPVNIHV